MSKKFSIFTFSFLLALTSCNSNQNNSSSANSSVIKNDSSSDSQTSAGSTGNNSKALVVYFSATNHTENVANAIANYIEVPIHKLEPTNPYTSADLNYSNRDSRVVKEYETTQSGNRVNVELTTTSFDEFEEATYIFLGAPVWWQQLSWVIENFVSENNFSNKTIIPFGTSTSSSFNLNNLTPLTEDDNNVTWLNPQRFSSSVASNTVISWIDSLNFDLR